MNAPDRSAQKEVLSGACRRSHAGTRRGAHRVLARRTADHGHPGKDMGRSCRRPAGQCEAAQGDEYADVSNAPASQLLAQLDTQERMLATKVEAVQATKTAYTSLYDALSAEQRKTVDELLETHMGLMPPGMMQAGMMSIRQNTQ